MSDESPPDGWEAHRRGEWCEDVSVVRAEVLRWLLVAAPRPVRGRLAEAVVQGAIRLQSCRFDGGQFSVLELTDCDLSGLTAVQARVGQECEIVGCAVDGTLDLRSLSVGTCRLLDRSTVDAPEDQAAIDAQSLAVEEDFSAAQLDCRGPIYLNSSRVQDPHGFRGARIRGDRAYLQALELSLSSSGCRNTEPGSAQSLTSHSRRGTALGPSSADTAVRVHSRTAPE
ncbi:hypothetical protein HRW07_02700 [Streptomyces lunaelactis]|uniref:hypothetical protein n=1 Tax=Streptomyces lunaelactis TaxID=1535768 RepID=UPI00158496A9|nr:hypothetical protein [Streptomyces lunaelactis]NUL02170.1 hypothetical protein [Streptomyces lunaelactis]